MTPMVRKGLFVAGLHVALVASLGAKLMVDRAMLPRVWVRAAPVDPSLPIRGRYVRLRLEVSPGPGLDFAPKNVELSGGRSYVQPPDRQPVNLAVEEGRLVARPGSESGGIVAEAIERNGRRIVLRDPVAYFIPEGVPDPSIRAAGEELWVEVTIPRRGGPRPIRLGFKKDGVLSPLDLR